MEVIVTGIMAKTIAIPTYYSCKANLGSVVKHVIFVCLFEEEAGQFFEEVLHIHPTCYSCYTM